MPRLRVHCFGVSLDGYGAGPRQSSDDPMGVGGMVLHEWIFPTRSFRQNHAEMGLGGEAEAGTTGIDDDFAARGFENVGAWIIGRNMFGPQRGPWLDDSWRGWWGEHPPFRTPVFVLTHHPREPLVMSGGTTFHFVTGGIREAYERAMEAAGNSDVRVGGGVHTIRQYLADGLIDEMHLAISPVFLGTGEHLLSGLNLPSLGYEVAECITAPSSVMHIVLRRQQQQNLHQ